MRGRFLHRQPPPGSRVNTQHPLGHGCVGWWEMNVGSGLVVPDISGQNNHGTMTNMDAATDWVQGRRGGEWALEFDGVDDCVNAGDFPQADGGSLSVNVWFAHTDTFDSGKTTDEAIVGKMGGITADQSWYIKLESDNGKIVTTFRGTAKHDLLSTTASWVGGRWYNVCATYDANTGGAKLYVDNILEDTDWGAAEPIKSGAEPVRFGALGHPSYRYWLYGLIGYVILHNRALSASEIAHLYAEPYAPIWTPGERKWWWMGATGGAYYYDHITKRIRGLI